jgi:pimeloyl-ACP methyl ester carboxylesterase
MDAVRIGAEPGLVAVPEPFDEPAIERRRTRALKLADGRVVRYIDEGDPEWRAFVFFGGLGTSARAFFLTEHARSLRTAHRLRAISVERNGFGETQFDPSLGLDDAAADVLAVLAARAVQRFSIVAFSGGGPFAAALATRVPERVLSLHLAAAAAGDLIVGSPAAAEIARLGDDPAALWEFPLDSAVHGIAGFTDAAAAEGRHALGTGHGAAALAHEWRLLCSGPLPSLASVTAPTYLYWGSADDVVPPAHAEAWRAVLGAPVTLRLFEGETHDVQYAHWDQILLDAAGVRP